jgi:hypothetical protein
MPSNWSEVGSVWVRLSSDKHYLKEIKFESISIWVWGAFILAVIAIIVAIIIAILALRSGKSSASASQPSSMR